jgi:hypothetical protein
MLYVIATLLMPILLVFGIYHLLTWFNVWDINRRPYWKRVAIASAISHVLLVSGFFLFSYLDYQQNRRISGTGLNFDSYLFDGSEFWRLTMIFDTAPMLVLVSLFSLMDRWRVNVSGLMLVTVAVIYVVGSLQWYFIGGGIGAVLERFWSGLKTGDEEDEDWL